MKKKKYVSKNGITLSGISMSENNRLHPQLLPRYMVALLGLISLMLCFCKCFTLTPSAGRPGLALLSAFFLGIFSFACCIKSARKVLLPSALGISALGIFLFRKQVYGGFLIVLNSVRMSLNANYYYNFPPIKIPPYSGNGRMLLCFMAAVIIIYSVIFSLSVVAKSCFSVTFFSSLPIIVLGIYCGKSPGIFIFLLLLSFWLLSLTMHTTEGKLSKSGGFVRLGTEEYIFASKRTRLGMSAIALSAVAVVCLATVLITLPISVFIKETRPQAIKDLRAKIFDYAGNVDLSDIMNEITSSKSTGDVNGGRLGRVDKLEYSGKTLLKVTLPYTARTLYLKGYSGNAYTGDSWGNCDYEFEFEGNSAAKDYSTDLYPQNIPSRLFSMRNELAATDNTYLTRLGHSPLSMHGLSVPQRFGITVINTGANRSYLYAPYRSVFPTDGSVEFVGDSHVTPRGNLKYEIAFYPEKELIQHSSDSGERYENWNEVLQEYAGDLPISDNYTLNYKLYEESYCEYVYKTCLDVPEHLLPYLTKYSEMNVENYYEPIRTQRTKLILDAIKKELSETAEYNLSPGRLGNDKDFIETFLISRKGYCSHFASAAVMMLRAAGIPARYTEGFIIQPVGDENSRYEYYTAEVRDSCAHAWVEYYVPGYGWAVFDPTPSGALDASVELVPSIAYKTEETTAKSGGSGTGTYYSEATSGTTMPEQVVSTTASETTTASVTEKKVPEHEEAREFSSAVKLLIIILCVILLLIISAGLILLRHRLTVRHRTKLINSDNRRSAVLACYEYFISLAEYGGIKNTENLHANDFARLLEQEFPFFSHGSVWDFFSLVMKVEFSNEDITKDEQEACIAFVNGFAEQLMLDMNRTEKQIFIYIKCLK